MKLIYTTLLLSSLACPADDYLNFIRESHFITGIPGETPHYEYHTDIDNSDGAKGKLGVLNKTVYDLYVIETKDLTKEYILDSKTVYTHAPTAELSIISADPETAIPRTRADKPFYVTRSVNNLTPASEIANPRFNSVVLMSETSNDRVTLDRISSNETAQSFEYNPLDLMKATDPTTTSGTIKFTINENSAVDADEFASQDVQILPKHVPSFSGIEANEEYYNIPSVTLQINNMYPASTAVLYAFPTNNPSNIKDVTTGQIKNLQNTLNSTEDVTVNVNEIIDEEGEWTLVWQLIDTPWENDILHTVKFNKIVKLKVNANISTQN